MTHRGPVADVGESARVAAQETWTATEPFAVTITPVGLLDL